MKHLSGTKLTEASANVFKYPDWNSKVLTKIFYGCQDVFFLTAWLKQSMSGKLCVCAHTSVKDHVVLKQMETCKH